MAITAHVFRLYNLNQLAETLEIDENKIYRELGKLSIYQLRKMFIEFGCQEAIRLIKELKEKSAATHSRYRVTISIDDTVVDRFGRMMPLTYSWYSGRWKKTVKGQNIIAITIKIKDQIIPLAIRPVSKQGKANTSKPEIFKSMLKEITDIFKKEGIEISQFPITFDSWYASDDLVNILSDAEFQQIVIHAKSNYVFSINGLKQKLSKHKSTNLWPPCNPRLQNEVLPCLPVHLLRQ